MGLDMFATYANDEVEDELAYWRKHYSLDVWMQNLYHLRGGTDTFNCKRVDLDAEDLEDLEHAILEGILPEGRYEYHDYKEYDLEFIQNAMDKIYQGYKVTYSNWW